MGAESLQRRAPRWLEAFIATRAVAGVAKKSLDDVPCDDPRAQHSRLMMVHVQLAAAVRDDERFVAVVSCGRSQNASISVGFSIATTASLSAGIPHCNSAPSDVSVEIVFHILSTNTRGFAAVAVAAR